MAGTVAGTQATSTAVRTVDGDAVGVFHCTRAARVQGSWVLCIICIVYNTVNTIKYCIIHNTAADPRVLSYPGPTSKLRRCRLTIRAAALAVVMGRARCSIEQRRNQPQRGVPTPRPATRGSNYSHNVTHTTCTHKLVSPSYLAHGYVP